jgi:hypothetical protein
VPARLSACRGVLVDSNILGLAACAEQALDAALLAGKCFLLYGRRGGPRNSPLPDFYIGAQAAIGALSQLFSDP